MTTDNSLVSVIIPAYNHENYVQETIRSIINQTYKNIELLVLDDGSKDSTWQKINELKEACEKRFVRTVFKTQDNQGLNTTNNRLLDMAQGGYVFIIASDDACVPETIEKEYKFLSGNPDYILVSGNSVMIDSSSKILDFWGHFEKERLGDFKTFAEYVSGKDGVPGFNSEEFGGYKTLAQTNYIPNGYLIRKSFFDSFRFTNEAPLEDWHMMLQIAKKGKLKFIDEVFFLYRSHGANTMKNRARMRELSLKTALYEIKLNERPGQEKFKEMFFNTINTRVNIINIPKIFSVYKIKNYLERNVFVEIFGKKFKIYHKDKV